MLSQHEVPRLALPIAEMDRRNLKGETKVRGARGTYERNEAGFWAHRGTPRHREHDVLDGPSGLLLSLHHVPNAPSDLRRGDRDLGERRPHGRHLDTHPM